MFPIATRWRVVPRPNIRFSAIVSRVLTVLALLLAVTAAPASAQQQQTVSSPARITQPVDNTVLATLKGNVHPLARPLYDKGPANASLPADRMQLVLKRSSGQEIALRQLLGSLQNPNSAQYRKWLTPEQFGAQYGVADADIQTVSAWLASQGFKINKVNKARTVIDFSGTVGQLQTAFHTQIRNYTVNGEQHFANATDPQIPAALAPVVAGVSRMNNFFAKPQHTKPMPGQFVKASGKFVPELTIGDAKNGYDLILGPGDAATIYDAPNAFNTKFSGSASYNGSGVSIGILGVSNIATTDVDNYRALFGLPAATPSIVIDGNDPGENGAELEALLDLEASGGLAPGAAQTFYIGADTNLNSGLFLAADRAIDDNVVSIISLSFGECELSLGETTNEYLYAEWEQAAAQGITVLTSAGDGGSAGCDDFDTETAAEYGLQVSGYASTPFNIAVGGTDYDVLGTDFTQYVSTANGANYTSALGYIPEEPWNNSTASNGPLSANTAYVDSNGNTNIVAGSGGISSCVNPLVAGNNYTCLPNPIDGTGTGWTKPSWQTGGNLNIPSDGVRDIPDVALLAGDGFYSAAWLVCADFSGQPDTCVLDSNNNFQFYYVGGTSASSPAFAGILALVSQSQGGARLGQANYVLYNLANRSSVYSSAFHDIASGNNSVYCVSNSLDCGTNLFETGYNAGAGYDLASGLGSVDIAQLIANWTKAAFTSTTTSFTINGGTAPVSITHGQSVTLSASVAGASGAPTGDVAIIANANQQAGTYNSNSLTGYTLSGGATGPQPYADLPGGTYTVSANYGGDIDYAESQSPGVQVTVAPEASVLNLFALAGIQSTSNTAVAISGSYPYGTAFSFDAQPIGVNEESLNNPPAATGTVTFTDTAGSLPGSTSSSSPGVVAINSNGVAELPVYYWSPASHSISASYSGDNSLNASATTSPITFTIAPAATASTVSATPTTVSGGTFMITSLIVPAPGSFATSPTGTVTLTVNGTTIGSGAVAAYQDPNTGYSEANVAITANASSLSSGANTITAAYSGDANYAASSGTVVVTSTPVAASLALTNTAATVSSPGQSGTSTITITPSGGYTGTVDLTCALTTAPSGADATYNPTCSLSANSVVISSATAGTATATFATTAPTTGALAYPAIGQRPNRWYTAVGGAALACVLFFGIPARRRGWKSMLGLLVFLVAIAGVGCGGGGGGGGGSGTPGTTTGTYTFTVTGTDSVTSTKTANTVVTVTVN